MVNKGMARRVKLPKELNITSATMDGGMREKKVSMINEVRPRVRKIGIPEARKHPNIMANAKVKATNPSGFAQCSSCEAPFAQGRNGISSTIDVLFASEP